MRKYSVFSATFVLFILFSCSSSKRITAISVPSISGLRFINEYIVPNDFQFKGTLVGGLSSIDYDPAKNLYYLICDDRSDKFPARFYTAGITLSDKGIESVQFTDAVTLLNHEDKPFPSHASTPARSVDPESMRYYPPGNYLVWGNEGERNMSRDKRALLDPSIERTRLDGTRLLNYELPYNLRMDTIEKGPRRNGVFEGLAFSGDYKYLFASVEEPLYQDGPRAGSGDSTAWVRVIKFDTRHRQALAQYAYQIDALPFAATPPGAFKINGISDILYAGKDQLLVIERAFISGRSSNVIRIYLADISNADDVSRIYSLYPEPAVRPISKKLILNMDDLGRYIDNIEGLTFGPVLPNGHRSLIFVSDNNFEDSQKTQFLLFEVLP